MNIFKKCYTCDVVKDGSIIGSAVATFWFWQTPVEAHKKLHKELTEAKPKEAIINFRRIK